MILKIIIGFILSNLFILQPLFALGVNKNSLIDDCHRIGGQVVGSWQCPTTGETKTTEDGKFFCMVNTKNDNTVVFNGCSTPSGVMTHYSELFYEACKRHDICYHNTLDHTSDGKHKCDLTFYNGMIATCKKRMGKNSIWGECGTTAGIFYQAVESFGFEAFTCSNVPIDPAEYVDFYDKSAYL